MPPWICRTCANQHADTAEPPQVCAVCEDPRQYVGWEGQRWATLEELAAEGHASDIRPLEPGLHGVGVTPQVGIGQRGLLVTTGAGNVLWDVPGYIDDAAIATVRGLGGIDAVSASHPHFYGVMVEWAHAFDAEILLPAADRAWVMRTDPAIRYYEDTVVLAPGVTLVRCGGHFDGSAVLHWAGGAGGAGVLLSGDTLTVVQDRDWISIMWSYPNLIPLDAATIREVASRVDALAYDRVYGGWWGRVVRGSAREKVARSIARYLRMIEG